MQLYFDSHCHLDFDAFDADRAEVWERAQTLGVRALFVPGIRPEQWSALPQLKRQIPTLCFGVGLHPYFLHEQSADALSQTLATLAQRASQLGAVAIGECGLDSRIAKCGGLSLEQQIDALVPQLDVAHALQLPVVLHVVGAHGRALQLLQQRGPLPAGGVLHAYSGSAELVPRYAALGLRFGFGGALTRPSARKVKEALRVVPRDRLLLETDAPDQAPTGFLGVPHAGGVRNEPGALPLVAHTICEQLGISADDLARTTTDNALTLFAGARVC
jgi:TatD DNase family protein